MPAPPVLVRPVTSVTPEVHVVEEGALASITCHIMGFPLPEVTWRDGRTNLVVNNSVEGQWDKQCWYHRRHLFSEI